MSEAVGALMAGVILSESGVREEIEQRFFALRDVFAALFFFAFALTIDLGKVGDVGWIVAARRASRRWSARSASACSPAGSAASRRVRA